MTDPLLTFHADAPATAEQAQAQLSDLEGQITMLGARAARARTLGFALACKAYLDLSPQVSLTVRNIYEHRYSDSDPEVQTLHIALWDASGKDISQMHLRSRARDGGAGLSCGRELHRLLAPFYRDTIRGLDMVGRLVEALPPKITAQSWEASFERALDKAMGPGSWGQWRAQAERSALDQSVSRPQSPGSAPRV